MGHRLVSQRLPLKPEVTSNAGYDGRSSGHLEQNHGPFVIPFPFPLTRWKGSLHNPSFYHSELPHHKPLNHTVQQHRPKLSKLWSKRILSLYKTLSQVFIKVIEIWLTQNLHHSKLHSKFSFILSLDQRLYYHRQSRQSQHVSKVLLMLLKPCFLRVSVMASFNCQLSYLELLWRRALMMCCIH